MNSGTDFPDSVFSAQPGRANVAMDADDPRWPGGSAARPTNLCNCGGSMVHSPGAPGCAMSSAACCLVHQLGKCDAVFTCCDRCPTFFADRAKPIYGKPFHGWSCDCDECKGYDERGEPRPGEAPRPQASAATAPGPDTRPDLCWSRHLDNIGKPRPTAVWSITYGCENGHEITTNLCDRCASSLVDGRQHCAVCVRRMTVTSLTAMGAVDA